MDMIRRLFRKKNKDELQDGKVTHKSPYQLACQFIANDFGTCFVSVTMQCILAMQATREAFMSLPDQVYSDISDEITYRLSLTTLIRFFFLERPKVMSREEQKEYSRNDLYPATNIANWLHEMFPDSFSSLGKGNSSTNTLLVILQTIIKEGYVKGLAEDLSGKYETRTTCKSCGATYDRLDETIMLSFSVIKEENFDLFRYLKSHAGDVKNKSHGRNNSTGFLTLGELFYFADVITRGSGVHMFYHSKSSGCDNVYDISHRTTIRHLPRTLILDINYVQCSKNMWTYEEFLDLSEHMESRSSTISNNKLVAVIKEVMSGKHVIAFVRASKYVNQTANISAVHYENRWLRMDDDIIELVNLEEVFEVRPTERCLLFIYEQLK